MRPVFLHVAEAESGCEAIGARAQALQAGFHGIECPLFAGRVAGFEADAVTASIAASASLGAIEDVCRLLHDVASCGAPVLNLEIQPERREIDHAGNSSYRETLNSCYLMLHALRHEAEASGVAIAVEACSDGVSFSSVELRELVDRVNSWAVGACIDLTRVAQGSDPAEWHRTLGHRIHSIRVDAFQPMAELELLARVLDGERYEGPVIVRLGSASAPAVSERGRSLVKLLGGPVDKAPVSWQRRC